MDKIEEQGFIGSFNKYARHIRDWADGKGFWDERNRNVGEIIALIHSELSECLESERHGNPPDEHCPEFGNTEIELADCVIRIMDFAAHRGLPLGEAIVAKMKYNHTRPHKHGKKF